MSKTTIYKCDLPTCNKLTEDAISFQLIISNGTTGTLDFSFNPKIYEEHVCCIKHLIELFANETEALERVFALDKTISRGK